MRIAAVNAAAIALLLSGCANDGGITRNKLDPATAVTITYSQTPLVFYRDESGRAAFARDYLYLGPLEINRMGDYRYYLWLGIWNTMVAAESPALRDGFQSIVIYADGEPLPLQVSGWTADAIGASERVYTQPVASAADAYYEVTIDQLRLVAAATEVRVQTTGTRPESYEPWDKQASAKSDLAAFLEQSTY